MEDEKIVQLYFNRDENAIKYTADKYSSKLCNISYKIVRDTCTVQECENDTYMETWKRIPPSNPKDYFLLFLPGLFVLSPLTDTGKKPALKEIAILLNCLKSLITVFLQLIVLKVKLKQNC